MSLTYENVQDILQIVDSACEELHVETRDFKLFVRKVNSCRVSRSQEPAVEVEPPAEPSPVAVAAEPALLPPLQPDLVLKHGQFAFASPMLGTFYRAPAPDAPPFVDVGSQVAPGDTLCIIEVMKLMNTIKAERAGRVVAILAENAAMVEFGQPLIVFDPT